VTARVPLDCQPDNVGSGFRRRTLPDADDLVLRLDANTQPGATKSYSPSDKTVKPAPSGVKAANLETSKMSTQTDVSLTTNPKIVSPLPA